MENEEGVTNTAPNEVSDEESGSLSLDELASRLQAGFNNEEESDETNASEDLEYESEATDETTVADEEEEEDEEEATQSEDEDDFETEEKPDVLSQYNIDLETIPDADAMAINKALGGKSHKRINQLTAKLRQAEEELKELRTETPPVPVSTTGEAFSNVYDLDDLQKQESSIEKEIRWAEDQLHNDPQINDDGEEYIYSEGDKYFTKDDVRNFLKAKKEERDAVPERRKFLVKLEENDKIASQYFPELDNPELPYSDEIERLKKDPDYGGIFNSPKRKLLAGLLFLGQETLEKHLKAKNGKPIQGSAKAKPKAKAPAPAAAGIGTTRVTSTKKKQKEIESRRNRLKSSGSVDDLADLIKLKL